MKLAICDCTTPIQQSVPGRLFAPAAAVLFLAAACTTPAPVSDSPRTTGQVQARYETDPVISQQALNPAVWINSDDPARSLIIATAGTDGLRVHAMDGRMLNSKPVGQLSGVAVVGLQRSRQGERLLVAAADSTRSSIRILAIDPNSGEIAPAPVEIAGLDFAPRGICASRLAGGTAEMFAFSARGELVRFSVAVPRFGDVSVRTVARLDMKSSLEDCVADPIRRSVWVAQKGTGIWRLPLRMETGSRPDPVARVGEGGLGFDPAGLALVRASGRVLIVASNANEGLFAAFGVTTGRIASGIIRTAESARVKGRFRIVASDDIDAVTGSRRLDAGGSSGIPGLAGGVLVVQDDVDEPGEEQNLKLLALDDVLGVL